MSRRRPRPLAALLSSAGASVVVATALTTPASTSAFLDVETIGVTARAGTWQTDSLAALAGVDLTACGPLDQYELVVGTPGDDVLGRWSTAGEGPQLVVGLGGDDTLVGGPGADCLVGGAGEDTLYAGRDRDVLVGGDGSDLLAGGWGLDRYVDGGATDTCLSRGAVGEPEGAGCQVGTTPEAGAGTAAPSVDRPETDGDQPAARPAAPGADAGTPTATPEPTPVPAAPPAAPLAAPPAGEPPAPPAVDDAPSRPDPSPFPESATTAPVNGEG
jgi:hypothetical protein